MTAPETVPKPIVRRTVDVLGYGRVSVVIKNFSGLSQIASAAVGILMLTKHRERCSIGGRVSSAGSLQPTAATH